MLWVTLVPGGLGHLYGLSVSCVRPAAGLCRDAGGGLGPRADTVWGSFTHDISFLVDQSEIW